jgi:hypothetical protein
MAFLRRRWVPFVAVAAIAVLGAGIARALTLGPGSLTAAEPSGGHGMHTSGGASAPAPAGTTLSDGSFALELAAPVARVGRARIDFTIRDLRAGTPLRSYEVEQAKKLHLIAVGADAHGFQHVHPRLLPDGRWLADDLRFDRAGPWRLIADFVPAGGERTVLATNLLVTGGAFRARPFVESRRIGAEAWRSSAGAYAVSVQATHFAAGGEGVLRFTVERAGKPVRDLQPYLGALGHCVLLRTGDLSYVHVHPEETDGSGPTISFETAYPAGAPLAMFLQFRHEGKVHTAEFRLPAPPVTPR